VGENGILPTLREKGLKTMTTNKPVSPFAQLSAEGLYRIGSNCIWNNQKVEVLAIGNLNSTFRLIQCVGPRGEYTQWVAVCLLSPLPDTCNLQQENAQMREQLDTLQQKYERLEEDYEQLKWKWDHRDDDTTYD
jgi:hypothetical protein